MLQLAEWLQCREAVIRQQQLLQLPAVNNVLGILQVRVRDLQPLIDLMAT